MILLATMPLWLATMLVLLLAAAVSVTGPPIVRCLVPFERLMTNNEVAGFKFATVSVLYAVLLGLAVIVVWGKSNLAENIVTQEALGGCVHLPSIRGLPKDEGAELRLAMTDYLQRAATEDWPAMGRGKASPATTQALDSLYAKLLSFHQPEPGNWRSKQKYYASLILLHRHAEHA